MYNRMQVQEALQNPQSIPNAMLSRYEQGANPQVLPEDAKYEELRRARMADSAMGIQALKANPSQTPTIMAQKEMEIAQLKQMLEGAMRNGAMQRQSMGLPMAMGRPMQAPAAPPPPMQAPAAPQPQPMPPAPPQEAGLPSLPADNMAQGFAPGGIVSFSRGGGAFGVDFDFLDPNDEGYIAPTPSSKDIDSDIRAQLYREAVKNVPSIQAAMAERRRLREEQGLGNIYEEREKRLAAREAEYGKEKEGRGLGALASSLASFAAAPRKQALGAAAQSLQSQVQQNKALDKQFALSIAEARDRIEDSKLKIAEGDIEAGIAQREKALKQVQDSRKMLLDAGYKDEQIKAMMERIAASERNTERNIEAKLQIAEIRNELRAAQANAGGKTDLQSAQRAFAAKLEAANSKLPENQRLSKEEIQTKAYEEAAKLVQGPRLDSAAASRLRAETLNAKSLGEALAKLKLDPAYITADAEGKKVLEQEVRNRFPSSAPSGALPYPQSSSSRPPPPPGFVPNSR
jgi:hypothetical protein